MPDSEQNVEEVIQEIEPEAPAEPVAAAEPDEPTEPTEPEEPEEPVAAAESEEPEEPVAAAESEEPEEPVAASESEEPVAAAESDEPPAPTVPVQEVATEIRNILSDVPSEPVESVVENDNICSLKTLRFVLGGWSNRSIRRQGIEYLLKENSEVDENLDDIEKVNEVLKLWIQEGNKVFRTHNYFLNIDEYNLSEESRNLDNQQKVEILKTLTNLVINVSQRKTTNEERDNILDNIYN